MLWRTMSPPTTTHPLITLIVRHMGALSGTAENHRQTESRTLWDQSKIPHCSKQQWNRHLLHRQCHKRGEQYVSLHVCHHGLSLWSPCHSSHLNVTFAPAHAQEGGGLRRQGSMPIRTQTQALMFPIADMSSSLPTEQVVSEEMAEAAKGLAGES